MSSLFLRVACKTEHTPVHVGYRSGGIKSARSCEYIAYNISPCRFLPPLVAQAAGESRQTIGPPQCVSCYNIQLFGIRCVCVCMCTYDHHIYQEHGSTGQGCHSCSWSAEQGKLIFSCPRSCLRIWSRETGLAVPSRVSLFIIHTQAESGAYLRDSSRFPRRRSFIYLNRHTPSGQSRVYRVSRNCVPMAFIAKSPPAQGQ